jgi:hypothetical protein
MYKLVKSPVTGLVNVVNRQVGEVLYSIPFNPDNTDYQAFLAWKAEGNEPLPADDNGQAAE